MTLIPADLREAVVQRAGNRCEYCHLSQELQVATFPVDHIVPVVAGGKTELENLALACPRCNALEWTHTESEDPDSGQPIPLFDPRRQHWADHFRWSETDAVTLEALTPTGRATLAPLDLNSEQHLRIRRWLVALGSPPSA